MPSLLLLAGDGIGPEVVDQSFRVLDAIAPAVGPTLKKITAGSR